ncbi:MAG: YebC/PmpR family DNA-binding transcriptional regulator [Nitrospirota bacterium]|nr:YebC/PmpR family DNA-binding transcriptional regulator [Nitrospirota bacterium]
MSGHSKWATTKHRKAAVDAKRSKIFTKLGKEITVAAKMGGGDTETNPRLRLAVIKARSSNMPMDNIQRAIQKGTGELPGVVYEEIVYEGYGPGGVAVLIDVATDNRNRTVGEIRHILGKHGGKMGETGCVGWMFHRKGVITVPAEGRSEDQMMEIALSAGAEDLQNLEDSFQIVTDPADFETVLDAIKAAGIAPSGAEVQRMPDNQVQIESKDAANMIKIMDLLEDHDDVQSVAANFDMSDEVLAQVMGG